MLWAMTSSPQTSGVTERSDEVRRFVVENQPVRGHWVRLDAAWRELRTHTNYPAPVRELLGESVSASVLLAATLKFQGSLTLQFEGQDGVISLLVAQCTHDFRVRAVAHYSEEKLLAAGLAGVSEAEMFQRLVGRDGRVVVTIEATEREARYQGIVPLTGSSLAECLEAYFASSEQLPTRVRLASNDQQAAGLLVQKLPTRDGGDHSPELAAWSKAQRSLEALEAGELLEAPVEELLVRRFGQQDLRLFKGTPVQFACRCSLERVSGLLRTLGIEELRQVVREEGAVTVTCEFCRRPYRFDAIDVEQLFAPDTPAGGSPMLH